MENKKEEGREKGKEGKEREGRAGVEGKSLGGEGRGERRG